MKQIFLTSLLLMALTIFSVNNVAAQNSNSINEKIQPELKTYLIERDIPGAGQLTATDLKGISQKSCTVLKEMGSRISWVQGFRLLLLPKLTTRSVLKQQSNPAIIH